MTDSNRTRCNPARAAMLEVVQESGGLREGVAAQVARQTNVPEAHVCNATGHLARSCNGKPYCVYRIDHRILGDPAPGCAKDYVARWWCGGQTRSGRTRGEASGKTLTLSCR